MLDARPPATSAEIHAMYRLRYEVYCREKQYIDAARCPDGCEIDALDACSAHFVVVDSHAPGQVLGCVRLIRNNPHGLPMLRQMEITAPLPAAQDAAEVSRLILAPDRRRSVEPILLMLREIYRYCAEHAVDYLFMIMERPLVRFLNHHGFSAEIVGRPRTYMNSVNAPYLIDMNRFRREAATVNPRFFAMLQEAGIEESCHAIV